MHEDVDTESPDTWSNHETWIIAEWIQHDRTLFERITKAVGAFLDENKALIDIHSQAAADLLGKALDCEFADMWPMLHGWQDDLLSAAYARVNLREIAEKYIADYLGLEK